MFLYCYTILLIHLNLGSPPMCNVSELTSDRALEGAIMIKSNDCHFVGWLAIVFPVSPAATQAAAKAHRSQTTQKQQCANYHQQPARSPRGSESSVISAFYLRLWHHQPSMSPL